MSASGSLHFSGASSQGQSRNASSRNAGPRSNSSNTQQQGASNARSSLSGARPKQHRGPPSPKKPLYMAESFESLWDKITEGIDWDADPIRLSWGISDLIDEANEAYEQKDEEKAFVLYERYISLWFHIKESKEYTYLYQAFDPVLEDEDFGTALDRIDELIPSLESRYSERASPSQVSRDPQTQTSASVSRNNNSSGPGQSQRQTLQAPQPAPRNVTSSSPNSTSSTLSQASTSDRSAATVPSQVAVNTKQNMQNQATGTIQPKQNSLAKKGLNIEAMKGFRENLLCPICLDLFKNAKSLPCGHAVCEECIGEWVTSKGGLLTCPTCKNKHSVPSGGVASLAPNFSLNNLVAEWKKLEEKVDSEVGDEDELPIAAATPPSPVTVHSGLAIVTSVFNAVTLQPPSSDVPSAETSFIEKDTSRSNRDVKGSTIELRVQLRDSKGANLRGRGCGRGCSRGCYKVEAVVVSPSNERKNVPGFLMERSGDYTLSFTPSKVGIHLVEAYLNSTQICGSPLKVIVRPSVKFDETIRLSLKHPLDVVARGSVMYTTADSSGDAFYGTDWQGNWAFFTQDKYDEMIDSFALALSDSKFYVTVPNKSCVHVYDLYGNCKNKFGRRVLETPTGIAVSGIGRIFVADSGSNTIEVFRSNFSHMDYIEAGVNGDNSSLTLLALNPGEDRLIATDKGANCFIIFDVVSLNVVKMITTRVQQTLAKPFGVAVDRDGNILVSVTFDSSRQRRGEGHNQVNNCHTGAVIMYNSEGYFLGKFGDNEMKNPCGLCILEDKVIVVDEGAGTQSSLRVYKL